MARTTRSPRLERVDLVCAVASSSTEKPRTRSVSSSESKPFVRRPVDERREVSGRDVAGVAVGSTRQRTSVAKASSGMSGDDEAVQPLDELLRVALDRGGAARQVGAGRGHQDGRGEAVAGDVADEEVERAVRRLHDVVVVASRLLRRLLPGREAEPGDARAAGAGGGSPGSFAPARSRSPSARASAPLRGGAASRGRARRGCRGRGGSPRRRRRTATSPFLFIASMTPTTEPDGVDEGDAEDAPRPVAGLLVDVVGEARVLVGVRDGDGLAGPRDEAGDAEPGGRRMSVESCATRVQRLPSGSRRKRLVRSASTSRVAEATISSRSGCSCRTPGHRLRDLEERAEVLELLLDRRTSWRRATCYFRRSGDSTR